MVSITCVFVISGSGKDWCCLLSTSTSFFFIPSVTLGVQWVSKFQSCCAAIALSWPTSIIILVDRFFSLVFSLFLEIGHTYCRFSQYSKSDHLDLDSTYYEDLIFSNLINSKGKPMLLGRNASISNECRSKGRICHHVNFEIRAYVSECRYGC